MDLTIISASGSLLAGVAAVAGLYVAYTVHQNQKLLSKRQLILPLWDHMATLSEIDPTSPNPVDVIKVVNTLELVAICCEGGMVDEQTIMRTFSAQFVKHYENIEKCPAMPDLGGKDGKSILKENNSTAEFYIKLSNLGRAQNRLTR